MFIKVCLINLLTFKKQFEDRKQFHMDKQTPRSKYLNNKVDDSIGSYYKGKENPTGTTIPISSLIDERLTQVEQKMIMSSC